MPSSVFLLDEFLHWLRTVDGLHLHVTLRDYRRIQQVLLSRGEWTHIKLQQVLASLLVHDREQVATFGQAYRQFFAVTADDEDTPVPLDAQRLRAELQQLAQRSVDTGVIPDTDKTVSTSVVLPQPSWWKRKTTRWWLVGLLVVLLVVAAGFAYQYFKPVPVEPTPKSTYRLNTPIAAIGILGGSTIDTSIKPVVPQTVPVTGTAFSLWWWLLPLMGALFSGFAAYRHRQLDRIPDLPAALPVNAAGKAYFDPARIGGRMPEWLDKDTLDYCADSVGFFLTDESSHELDMPATIHATVAAGGIPEIRLLRRKQLFHLLILTDVLGDGSRWNPLAEELADGLRRRGLPVTLGRLRGTMRDFYTDEGQHTELLELAEERGRYVTLVFADARLPDPVRERDVLDELRQWPQLGWLTFCEPRYWGGAEQRLQQYGIHLWEATPDNLPDVFRHLAGEMLRNPLAQVPDGAWRVQQPQEPLAHYLPRALGDALPLARLAALFPPPVSPALLVRLLQAFYPRLPLTRLQRLYRLPGGTQDAGGLGLSLATLKLLRGQFYALHDDGQRRKTIETLLEWMQEAEPSERESPAWWGWRWRYARLLAELDVDRAYPLLEAVERSGVLAEGLAADLESLPITALPQQAETLKSLYQLGKRHGFVLLEKAQAVPQAPFWNRSVWAGSAATAVLALAVGAWQFWPVPPPPSPVVVANPPTPTPPATPPISASLPAMVKIPGGTFEMGCVENNSDCQDDEKPVHTVTVPAFEMGAYEVTVEQFKAFAEATQYQTTAEKDGSCYSYDASGSYNDVKGNSWQKTGYTQTENSPVTCVSWDDAQAYLKWVSEQTKQIWRLPTEAEWEYAAREKTKTAYSWGEPPPVCDTQAANGAQFVDCKEKAPLKVGSFKPNPFGLYDVHGNALEWVEDCWQGDYKDAPVDGSARQGCGADASRVLRGGSWGSDPQGLRSAYRYSSTPSAQSSGVGFRAARTINPLPFTGKGTADQVSSYYDYSGSTSGTTATTSPTSKKGAYTGVGTYVVQPGDTVFQVMRNTGAYWKDIIRLNNLQAPDYAIKPSQTLRLK